MKYGYVKVVSASPDIRVADVGYNAEKIIDTVRGAGNDTALIVMPELSLCGSTCGDLFRQETLINACENAVRKILSATEYIDAVFTVGAPIRLNNALFNCIIVIHTGKILGIVPKEYPSCTGDLGDARYFAPAPGENTVLPYAGNDVPFGRNLIFSMSDMPEFSLGIVVGEDAFLPSPLSEDLALAGAAVIADCSASAEAVGKAERRRQLITGLSKRLSCAYVYSNASTGESTTDMVFSAHGIIAENGNILKESAPFDKGLAESEADVSMLNSVRASSDMFFCGRSGYDTIAFNMKKRNTSLTREYSKYPFVPDHKKERREVCELILSVQAQGLARRMEHSRAEKAVVGISGGLDSCLALLAAVRALKILGRPASDVLCVTMPCFGTTKRTRRNAETLVMSLGASFECVDITKSVTAHFHDIGHDINNKDVVFENAQARARTYVLMDIANRENGIVVGTGDLSELALGWATYNGDHMSMYGVNAGVPKTLIRHIVSHVADTASDAVFSSVLKDILATPVSPELLPAENGEISQITEDIVGPYELHDFILYYAVRRGFAPAKIMLLLKHSFDDKYDTETLKKWLVNFYRRFFSQQFKRSCLPDGPKVGSVSLSPRGAFSVPSDAVAALWIKEAETL